ncbi:MAG TPA: hypothetical protein VNW15_07255 [Rhizomicrobium sp.]|jgi:hypothetical protein|nr:hypothetical protein [Rhizomicrobium sp.]
MKRLAFAFLLMVTPASADELYSLYAGGNYEEAMRAGAAAGTSEGFAIAARAALADAAIRPQPCLACLRRAEDFARRAVATDTHEADGHVWLAAALGLEGRIIGMIRARLANSPGEAKDELDAALKDDPRNAYALAAAGGWNIEIVRAGGGFLARTLYGARETDGIALFDRAVEAAPGNVAVRYQIGLSLAGYKPELFRGRIAQELEAAIADTPQTSYEKFIQARAAELLALQRKNDPDAFAVKVRKFQGYPD